MVYLLTVLFIYLYSLSTYIFESSMGYFFQFYRVPRNDTTPVHLIKICVLKDTFELFIVCVYTNMWQANMFLNVRSKRYWKLRQIDP